MAALRINASDSTGADSRIIALYGSWQVKNFRLGRCEYSVCDVYGASWVFAQSNL